MRKVTSLTVLLALAPLAVGGDAAINGADKPVPVNSFAELSVVAKEGDKVSWTVYPPPVKKVDDGGGKLYFSGPPGCSYIVSVVVVNFESKRFDTGNATVTTAEAAPDEVVGATDPNCASGKPKPKPPTPVDQFQRKLQSAYDLEDPAEQKLVKSLAENFQYSADTLVGSATTWAGLWQAMSADAKQRGIPGHLNIVQKVVAAELSKALPTSVKEDQPLDAAGRQTAVAAFRRVSTALTRLK